jgi:hypothetical protein
MEGSGSGFVQMTNPDPGESKTYLMDLTNPDPDPPH